MTGFGKSRRRRRRHSPDHSGVALFALVVAILAVIASAFTRGRGM